MARNQELIQVGHNEVKELTNADVDAITFAVTRGLVHLLVADAAPDEAFSGWPYLVNTGELNKPLSDYSATGARVYVTGQSFPYSEVIVTHA